MQCTGKLSAISSLSEVKVIYSYGITAQGTHHIKADTPCQDAHSIAKISNDIVIAAVADGLGSEKYSDIASKIAVETSVNYCLLNINNEYSGEVVLSVISSSFDTALKSIEEEAKREGNDFYQYGTTLSLAVMIDNNLYYGHAGDSGIIVLTLDGLYKKITEQQRDDDGFVFPFTYNKEKWEFGSVENIASVLLATDGMFETFFPIYLINEDVKLYVALARFFMDINSLHIEEMGEDATKERIEKFIWNIPDGQVNDDKTVVVLVNTSIKAGLQPPEYYVEPDWAELKRKRNDIWKREAYPHLFKDETFNNQPSNDNNETKDRTNLQDGVFEKLENSVSVEDQNDNASPNFEPDTKENRQPNRLMAFIKKHI